MRKRDSVNSNSAHIAFCAFLTQPQGLQIRYFSILTRALLLLVVCFVVFSVAFVDVAVAGNNAGAAFSIWPDTGQTKCYDNNGSEISCPAPGEPFYGQDAQYQGPQRSYTKLGTNGVELPDHATQADGWIMTRDNITGLIWEIKTDDWGVHDRDNAYTWCDRNLGTNGGNQGECSDGIDTEYFINALNSANFGGYSDWRLPTVKELSTLVNHNISAPGPTIDTNYFPNTVSDGYWSSTTYASCIGNAWRVRFDNGHVYYYDYNDLLYNNKQLDGYVRAVRSGKSSVHVFVDNYDGTITDVTTGLMWEKCSMGQTYNSETNGCDGSANHYTWQRALAECENFELAGYSDWRLPNRNELQSIIDYSQYTPAINTVYFPDTVSDGYWSSTTDAYVTSHARLVYFNYGYLGSSDKNDRNYVRAVRSAQTGAPDNLELGDVSGDGQIDIIDALFVARYVAGLKVDNFNQAAADVNCDKSITILDALIIARKAAGLEVSGWGCES